MHIGSAQASGQPSSWCGAENPLRTAAEPGPAPSGLGEYTSLPGVGDCRVTEPQDSTSATPAPQTEEKHSGTLARSR
eukprot:9126632-Alexandrium_andersonii.AAC.1